MYTDRKAFYERIEREHNSKVIAYVTGDKPGMGTQIGIYAPDIFLEHLDVIGKVEKISLILYTSGGSIIAAWNIINLIREFCDELEIIIPHKCRSAGTLMSLGANKIIMSKQATLGPIDPSISSSLSPIVPNSNPPEKVSISVESVKGYFSLLKEEFGAKSDDAISAAYVKLTEHIHPLVLGDVYRTQKQIQMLAKKLLQKSYCNKKQINSIVSFLCCDSGSHDYTINRTEAKSLGLNVVSPSVDLYNGMKTWYNDVVTELDLKNPFNPSKILGTQTQQNYSIKRILIESVAYGEDAYISEGSLNTSSTTPTTINDTRTFEGWRHN